MMTMSAYSAPDGPVKVGTGSSLIEGGRHWVVELPDGQVFTLTPDGRLWNGRRYEDHAVVQESRAGSPSAVVAALTGRRSADEAWIREMETEMLLVSELESRHLPDADAVLAVLPAVRERARRTAEAHAATMGQEGAGR